MEILFVSHKYPPSVGGMEKQSYELIEGIKKFAKVHTIIHNGSGSKLGFFLTLEKRIVAKCRKHPNISVIHFNDGLIAAVCLRHKGYLHLKRTVTIHGLDAVFPNKVFQKNILPAFNRYDLIIAVSNATAQACISRGIHKEKVMVVSNGVDASIARQTDNSNNYAAVLKQYGIATKDKCILVAMGRPVKRKGFSWFIDNVLPALPNNVQLLLIGPYRPRPTAMELLLNILPTSLQKQIELLLGYPTDEKVLRKQLANPAYNNKVQHLGRLPFNHILAILKGANAFLVPNIPVDGDMEGFGLVCLEACLCAIPVYAAAIDGITDAIQQNKNGYLLPPADKNKWIEAITNVATGSFIIPPDMDAVNYTLNKFSWQKMAEEYYKAFQLLVKEDLLNSIPPTYVDAIVA